MAFSSLPVDVLDVLCQFIAESDLPAVARVNSRICPSAQRYLYRSLAFTSPAKAARCFKTLRRNPLLHRHVRELSLRADPYAPLLRSLVDLLGAVLADAQNLISLELVLPQCATNVFLAAEKKDTLYARLVNFSCNLPFNSALCSFLQRTPSVKVLQLSDYSSAYSDLPDLPISALPSLQAFTGSSDLATLLAPGRPLESVHLFSGELSQTIIDALSRSSSSIAIFGAFTTSLSPSILHCLAENLPHLHHLRIMTMYHTFNQPDESFYTQVVQILSTLPELVTAELAGFRWAPWKDPKGTTVVDRIKAKHASDAATEPEPENSHQTISDFDIGMY